MKFSDVIAGVGISSTFGGMKIRDDCDVIGVSCDTRTVRPGEIFFAVAPKFAALAMEKGALCTVAKKGVDVPGVPENDIFRCEDIRTSMAIAAANFFGRPAQRITLLGITGTNGKTTTSLLAESMLAAAGESVGVIGTIAYRYDGREVPAPNTTPGSIPLQKLLADMRRAGTTSVVMEVSSHALDQKRADAIPFAGAAFTNLTRDHLDYHGDMEVYFQSKRRLFTELCAGVCTLNVDDAYGRRLHNELVREGRVTFGFSSHTQEADLFVTDLKQDVNGMDATLHTPSGSAHFHSPLVGLHNVENILAATGLILGAGFELKDVIDGIQRLKRVPGRLDRVPSKARAVFIDYAHTDDALTNVIAALRPLTKGRLICVFGCGGDRDHGKRSLMGKAAAEGADIAIVTNDNPRSEDPMSIARMVLEGINSGGMIVVPPSQLDGTTKTKGVCTVELSREDAIRQAIKISLPDDVILIAGKGHETYQLIGNRQLDFDDRTVALKALDDLNRGGLQ